MSRPTGRPKGRAPDVDPDLIRQVMSRTPRPSIAEAAKYLAEYLGKPVSEPLIRSAVRRHRDKWNLGDPPKASTAGAPMDYEFVKALGPISPEHVKTHDWTMLSAYERSRAGLLAAQVPTAKNADGYVAKRRRLGLVTDYNQSQGFFTRPGLPWELEAKSYLKMPPPEYARLEVEAALADPDVLQEARSYWADWLSLARLDQVPSLPVRGRG